MSVTVQFTEPTFAELRSIVAANPPASAAGADTSTPVADLSSRTLDISPILADYIKRVPGAAFMAEVNRIATPDEKGVVVMPTGHVLSVPYSDLENFMGYFQRTSDQTGIGIVAARQALGALQGLQSGLYSFGTTSDHWPSMADEFAWRLLGAPGGVNPYAPVNVQAVQQASQNQPAQQQSAPSGVPGTSGYSWAQLDDNDRMFAIAKFKTTVVNGRGTDVPAAIAAAFGSDPSWSVFADSNAPAISNYNQAGYSGKLLGKI